MIPRILRDFIPCIALLACTALRLSGQDVTVSPLVWVNRLTAADQLPRGKLKKTPEFPAELRRTPDYGYAIVVLAVDPKGRASLSQVFASLHPFAEVAEAAFGDKNFRFKPARRNGRPIAAEVKYTVAFNPASASTDKPDAAPRLMAADTIVDPDPPKDARRDNGTEIVWVRLAIDAAGRAVAVRDAPERLVELLARQLDSFRFAPARQAGAAVPAEIRMPIIAIMGTMNPADVKPVLIKSVDPIYPETLLESGLNGEVIVEFIVDVSGNVTHAIIQRSFNPAFNQAALDAILQWKFQPGRNAGEAVPMRFREAMVFNVVGAARKDISGFVVQRIADPATPDGNDAEVSPAIRGAVVPVYPYALLRDGVSGRAAVTALIDAEGRIVAPKVIFADRPEFGEALLAAFEGFALDPALKHGRPVAARVAMMRNFSPKPRDRAIAKEDAALLSLEKKHPDAIVEPAALDTSPKLMAAPPRIFPTQLRAAGATGQAVVEMLIDTEGIARLQRLVSASAPAFGWAAIQALSGARFTPPRRQGKPVIVRLHYPVVFPDPTAPVAEP